MVEMRVQSNTQHDHKMRTNTSTLGINGIILISWNECPRNLSKVNLNADPIKHSCIHIGFSPFEQNNPKSWMAWRCIKVEVRKDQKLIHTASTHTYAPIHSSKYSPTKPRPVHIPQFIWMPQPYTQHSVIQMDRRMHTAQPPIHNYTFSARF